MVRLADLADLPAFMEDIVPPYHAELGQAPINMEKTEAWIGGLIQRQRLLGAWRGGVLAGGIGIAEVPYRYADASFLADELYYVRQEWRGESVGRELANAFRDIAIRAGKPAFITVLNPERVLRRGRVADIFGWIPFGYRQRIA